MNRFNLDAYRGAQCPFEKETGLVFFAVHQATNGRPPFLGAGYFYSASGETGKHS